MKPAPFDYVAARSLDEALEALAERADDAKALAGGQSLIPVLNFRLAQPAVLVDLNRVAGLDSVIEEAGGGLRLGALVRQRSLERDPRIARRAPLLAEATAYVAHPQIRNRGTLGGSLAHADPAAELPAVALALDAELTLRRRGGERRLAAREFFIGLFSTALAPGELVTEIRLPPSPPRTGHAFVEFARRHGDYALAGVAARVTLDEGGACRAARLVLVAVGDGPVDARRAAAALAGTALDAAALAAAAELAAGAEIDPLGDIHASAEFKRHLVRVLVVRALERARERAWEAE
ncbi:MAG TPA: xanthine dehydrogenase family protein subunit M [Thermoanaerobaculia bacterium]